MRDSRHPEATLAVAQLIKRYKTISTLEELRKLAEDAARTRKAYGDWRVRRLFAEADLINICEEQVQKPLRNMQSNLAREYVLFAIDNLAGSSDEEDKVRFALDAAVVEVPVPRRYWPQKEGVFESALAPGWTD